MAISSRVTVYDGTHTVAVDGRATLTISITDESAGGSTNLRMADGSITRQVAWEASRVTLACTGWMPPGLDSIDWDQQITLTVPKPGGTRQYIGYCDPPQDVRIAGSEIDCRWTLVLEVG